MDRVETFNQHRSLLSAIAYRMVGTVMETEDILQEAFLRWQQAAVDEIRNPKAYLSAVITRLCIDHLRSARVQREEYIGPWLPEPIVTDPAADPAKALALNESLSMAFLLILENLTPMERAVYLLREVFEYDYPSIAGIVGKSEANCRQMVSRARKHITDQRPRFTVAPEAGQRVTEQFLHTIDSGDMQGLMNLLADDVTWWSDGGGKIAAARKPILGAEKVARFAFKLAETAPPDVTARYAFINGGPGLIYYVAGTPHIVLTFDIVDNRIQTIRAVANPDKLQMLPPMADD